MPANVQQATTPAAAAASVMRRMDVMSLLPAQAVCTRPSWTGDHDRLRKRMPFLVPPRREAVHQHEEGCRSVEDSHRDVPDADPVGDTEVARDKKGPQRLR